VSSQPVGRWRKEAKKRLRAGLVQQVLTRAKGSCTRTRQHGAALEKALRLIQVQRQEATEDIEPFAVPGTRRKWERPTCPEPHATRAVHPSAWWCEDAAPFGANTDTGSVEEATKRGFFDQLCAAWTWMRKAARQVRGCCQRRRTGGINGGTEGISSPDGTVEEAATPVLGAEPTGGKVEGKGAHTSSACDEDIWGLVDEEEDGWDAVTHMRRTRRRGKGRDKRKRSAGRKRTPYRKVKGKADEDPTATVTDTPRQPYFLRCR
jgi:hypothetical protein